MPSQALVRAWVGLLLLNLALIPTAPAAAPEWTDGLFQELSHDFGAVPRGAKVRHVFVLTNRTKLPITIANVRVSCGCTTGIATPGPIAPGKAGVVEATMDTSNFNGRKQTGLFVTLVNGKGDEAEARLVVATTILSDIVLNPGSIDFGTLTRGVSPRKTLTIDRLGSPNWKAVRLISASRAIDAELIETVRSPSGVSYALTVTLKPEAPAGPLRDEIRILTNDPESTQIPILVTGLIRGDGLDAAPTSLTLSRDGRPGRYLVRAPRPFRILAVEGAGDGFEVAPITDQPRTAHSVAVRYTPPAKSPSPSSDVLRTFRVLTDLPDEAPLELTATLRAD